MPRRRRDSESESEASETEESGSESGSESESGSGSGSDSYDSGSGSGSDSESSEDDEELIKDALKSAGMKKYLKPLLKGGVTSVAAAQKLNDKKLTKLGVSSSSDRKKILKAMEEIESDSGSESGSDSDDEEAQVHSVLKKAGLKKYVRNFEKYGIETLKKAGRLDDVKLKKIGVSDAKHRKSIIKAFKSGGGDDAKVEKALKKADLKKYVKAVQENNLADKKVDEKDLKKAGIDKGSDRKKVMKVINKINKEKSDGSGSESGSESDDENETIRRLLAKANMKKYYSLFKKKGIETVDQAKALQHKDLREMGIHLYRERRDIIEEFEKYNGEELPTASSGSGEDSTDNVNMVHEVLRQQYMSRHIPDFDRMGITTLRQARKLTQTQLRSMGVALYLQRERLINAFADYRPKNKAIMKILIDCNLASHAREFEKLIDVEDAKNLTHSDLRAMGINLYGQRERLMRAFMEYKPKKSKE